MRKPAYFWNDLYFANIYYCPGWSDADVRAFIQNQFGFDYLKPMSGDGRCIVVESDDGHWGQVIQTRFNDISPRAMNALTHEALHAANSILRRAGVKVKIGVNDEAQTYLHAWVFTNLYRKTKGAPK